MTSIQRVLFDERKPAAVYVATFAVADVLVADDGATVPFDYATLLLRPTLERDFGPEWRSLDLVMAVAFLGGDGLAVGDGVNKTVPIPVAGAAIDVTTNTLTIDSVVAMKAQSLAPAVILGLIGSTDADAALDAAEIHRALVFIRPRILQDRQDDVPQPFLNLPETFTANLT